MSAVKVPAQYVRTLVKNMGNGDQAWIPASALAIDLDSLLYVNGNTPSQVDTIGISEPISIIRRPAGYRVDVCGCRRRFDPQALDLGVYLEVVTLTDSTDQIPR